MTDKRKPPSWQGLRRFTGGLFFFLAGLCAFVLKGYIGESAGKVLVGGGILLFLLGFVLASQGIARQWQEMAERDD